MALIVWLPTDRPLTGPLDATPPTTDTTGEPGIPVNFTDPTAAAPPATETLAWNVTAAPPSGLGFKELVTVVVVDTGAVDDPPPQVGGTELGGNTS